MKQNTNRTGYTLAELLITIAVVGVIAVILLGVLKNSHQDKDKALYLKTSMRLTNITSKLLNDEVAYPDKDTSENDEIKYNYSEYPFYNTYIYKKYAKKWGITPQDDNSKLCRFIAEKGYHEKALNCSDSNDDIPEYSTALTPSFSTHDGVDFYIYTKRTDKNKLEYKETIGEKNTPFGKYEGEYQTVVYIDTNGKDKGNNCIFDRSSCINPDVYKFMILGDGQIFPMDAMGMYYTQTSKDMKRKVYNEKIKEDREALDKINTLYTEEYQTERAKNSKAYIRPIVAEEDEVVKVDDSKDTGIEGDDGAAEIVVAKGTDPEPDKPVEPDEPEDPYVPIIEGLECNSTACKYDCTNAPLGPGYGAYTTSGGCSDGTAIMSNEDRQGTYEEAKNYCASIGTRLPTTHELSAVSNYATQMGVKTGNYWAEQNWPDGRSARNCYMPRGNCGVHNPNDVQYYRCVKE